MKKTRMVTLPSAPSFRDAIHKGIPTRRFWQILKTLQIRVHLSAIGHPVVGDTVYGVKSAYISRQFIHACRLGFHLPSSGEYVEFKSELAPDLEQALKDIG
ncbi:hypothetical protein M1N05_02125 [Dehalococcoidales bacterium]|nr:hypothetical protein [Dehalococcoidales bacterium]